MIYWIRNAWLYWKHPQWRETIRNEFRYTFTRKGRAKLNAEIDELVDRLKRR